MRYLLSLAVLGLFSAAIVGCEASGSVGDTDRDHETRTEIKKTTVNEGGAQKSGWTEIRRDNYSD